MQAGQKIQAAIWLQIKNSNNMIRDISRVSSAFVRSAGEIRKWVGIIPKNFKRVTSALKDISITAGNIKKFFGFKSGTKGMNSFANSTNKASKSVSGLKGTVSNLGAAFAVASGQVMSMGKSILNIGVSAQKALSKFTKETLTAGGTFQSSRIIFDQAFGDKGPKMFNAALKEAQKTSLSTTQILAQIPNFGRQGVDVLEKYNIKLKTGKELSVSGLQLLNDLVSATGQHSTVVFGNFNKALSGATRNFRALFDGLEKKVSKTTGKSFDDMFKAAKTSAERAKVIFQTISESGMGGISALTAQTYGFLLENLDDILTTIKGKIGEKLIEKFLPELISFGEALSSFADNAEVINLLVSAFDSTAAALKFLAAAGSRLISFFSRLAKVNPEILKLTISLAKTVPVILILVGAFITLAGAIGSFVTFVLPLLTTGLLPVVVILGAVTMATLQVGVVLGLAAIALRKHFGDLGKLMFDIQPAFWALIELVGNYENGITTMSKETSDALDATGNTGLIFWTIQLAGFMGRLISVTKEFFNFVIANRHLVVDAFSPAVDAAVELGGAVFEILDAVFDLRKGLNFKSSPFDSTISSIDLLKAAFFTTLGVIKFVSLSVARAIRGIKSILKSEGPGMLAPIKSAFNTFKKFVTSSWNKILAIINNPLMERFFKAIGVIIEATGSIISSFVQVLWAGIKIAGNLIAGLLDGPIALIKLLISFLPEITFEDVVVSLEHTGNALKVLAGIFKWLLESVIKPGSTAVIEFITKVRVGFAKMRSIAIPIIIKLKNLISDLVVTFVKLTAEMLKLVTLQSSFSSVTSAVSLIVGGGDSDTGSDRSIPTPTTRPATSDKESDKSHQAELLTVLRDGVIESRKTREGIEELNAKESPATGVVTGFGQLAGVGA